MPFDQIGYNGDDLDQGQTHLLPNIRVLGIHQLNQLGKTHHDANCSTQVLPQKVIANALVYLH